jgi:hypothetical protein
MTSRLADGVLTIAAVLIASALLTAQTAAPGPTATVKQVMVSTVIPSSDAIFQAAGEPPTTPAAWLALERHGLALVESGKSLMTGSRVVDRGDWLKFSQAFVDAAEGGAKAAAAKNADALSAASDALYETCETCHAKYMKK